MPGLDPKPWLEYGVLGAGILLLFLNMVFFHAMTSKQVGLFKELIPILESIKGHVKALQLHARDVKDTNLNNRRRQ